MKIKSVKELITRENIDEVFNISYKNFLGEENIFKELKSSQYFDLIKYLIRNGYIDETYEDYMTYFKAGSLTANDKIFLRSITDIKEKTYTIIKENELNQLDKYANENILAFMEVILDNCNQIIRDNIESVKEILNNSNISIDIKERYIEDLQTNIEDLSNIQNRILWRRLIVSNLVIFNKKMF